jgi:hypothetical protein
MKRRRTGQQTRRINIDPLTRQRRLDYKSKRRSAGNYRTRRTNGT